MTLITRRAALFAASLAAVPTPSWARDLSAGAFTHGVASGDPLSDRVILWTRFVSSAEGRVGWEVADDDAFANVVARGQAQARMASDFCVKVDAGGLRPGRRYFYRFLSASGPSPTGMTRTAPQGGAEQLSIAFFSCANLPYGYFHAYAHAAAREDIDLTLHLGDYIYEIQRGSYPPAGEAVAGRVIDPVTETVSLSDYYQRYASYHADPGLLELRRLKPMSVVWDDHELANDAWREGAQAHDPATEGAWSDRVAAASKAYFDWMPIRRPTQTGVRIYRSLDWGDLARIVLIDTRLIGRDHQLDYRRQLFARLAEQGADARAVAADMRRALDDPNRTMMGAAQEAWFADTLAQSKRAGQPWQVVAQQVVMAEQAAPQGIAGLLPDNVSAGQRQWFAGAEQTTALGLPWNLDNWSGYPAARARFLAACVANASNAVVLGGDSHNCWVNNLAAAEGNRLAAIEFAGGSVTSPGFERSLMRAAPGQREAMMRSANPNIAWCDLTRRGYGALKLTAGACDAEWIAFDSVREPLAPTPIVTRFSSAASASAGPGAWSVAS
ncbi:MAG TPA: alkaline phosphatase D family protein [Caulobacterales bacterium]|nr:alkaline phosphatase D family protein [Caulobacterales bacterium]